MGNPLLWGLIVFVAVPMAIDALKWLRKRFIKFNDTNYARSNTKKH